MFWSWSEAAVGYVGCGSPGDHCCDWTYGFIAVLLHCISTSCGERGREVGDGCCRGCRNQRDSGVEENSSPREHGTGQLCGSGWSIDVLPSYSTMEYVGGAA